MIIKEEENVKKNSVMFSIRFYLFLRSNSAESSKSQLQCECKLTFTNRCLISQSYILHAFLILYFI